MVRIHVFIKARGKNKVTRWYHRVIRDTADLHNVLAPFKRAKTYVSHKITKLT